MPNAATHRTVNFVVAAAYLASRPDDRQTGFAHPIIGATATATLASLPDLVEPAIHPNHRQFFHSVTFAALLAYGLYRVYKWQPENSADEFLKSGVLVAGSAYLLQLAADFLTAKSLPLVG